MIVSLKGRETVTDEGGMTIRLIKMYPTNFSLNLTSRWLFDYCQTKRDYT